MPVIRPVSDLRNKTPEIEEICIKEQQPVFITKNGTGHLVVMSQKMFEEQQMLLDIYDKLDEAEEDAASGRCRSFREVLAGLRSRVHAKISN